MTGREALMPAAILQVVKFPIRYTTKKLICTITPAKQRGKFEFAWIRKLQEILSVFVEIFDRWVHRF
jgi:hypothetical protein